MLKDRLRRLWRRH